MVARAQRCARSAGGGPRTHSVCCLCKAAACAALRALTPHHHHHKKTTQKNKAVAAECGVSAMPTFQVFRDGAKVAEFVGASKDKLKGMVEQHLA